MRIGRNDIGNNDETDNVKIIKNRYNFLILFKAFYQILVVVISGSIITFIAIYILGFELATPANPLFHFLNSCQVISILIFCITIVPYYIVIFYRQNRDGNCYNPKFIILSPNGLHHKYSPKVMEFFSWEEIIYIRHVNKHLSFIFLKYRFIEIKYNSRWTLSENGIKKDYNRSGDMIRIMVDSSEYDLLIKTRSGYKN